MLKKDQHHFRWKLVLYEGCSHQRSCYQSALLICREAFVQWAATYCLEVSHPYESTIFNKQNTEVIRSLLSTLRIEDAISSWIGRCLRFLHKRSWLWLSINSACRLTRENRVHDFLPNILCLYLPFPECIFQLCSLENADDSSCLCIALRWG